MSISCSTTCDSTQLRHLRAFPVLSCFLCNEVCTAPYSLWTNVTFIIQDLDLAGRGFCGTLGGITEWTDCFMVCRLSATSREAELELIWSGRHGTVWAGLRTRQLHLSVHMCVIDKGIFKTVLLTTRQLLLDMTETSPPGIIFNQVMLQNIFYYDRGQG